MAGNAASVGVGDTVVGGDGAGAGDLKATGAGFDNVVLKHLNITAIDLNGKTERRGDGVLPDNGSGSV